MRSNLVGQIFALDIEHVRVYFTRDESQGSGDRLNVMDRRFFFSFFSYHPAHLSHHPLFLYLSFSVSFPRNNPSVCQSLCSTPRLSIVNEVLQRFQIERTIDHVPIYVYVYIHIHITMYVCVCVYIFRLSPTPKVIHLLVTGDLLQHLLQIILHFFQVSKQQCP